MLALSKNPPVRPQSAAAFARSLRAQSEGVGALYRKAFALYSEHFPKFVRLSLIAHLPVIALTLLMIALQLAEKSLPKLVLLVSVFVVALLEIAAYFIAASVISGVTALIVTQLQVAPMRPVQLRTAFDVLRRRWRPFLRTGIRVSLKVILGYCLLLIPGLVVATRNLLYAPVVLMENLEGKAALRRARSLAARSWRTVIVISLCQFLRPVLVGLLLGRFSVKAQHVNAGVGMHVSQNLTGLVNIFIVPLLSIVPALLYLKMRQMGGESVTDTLAQIEEVEATHTNWQRRMRERLSGYTPQTRSRVATPQQTPSDPSKLA
jgi:hypothetical protein